MEVEKLVNYVNSQIAECLEGLLKFLTSSPSIHLPTKCTSNLSGSNYNLEDIQQIGQCNRARQEHISKVKGHSPVVNRINSTQNSKQHSQIGIGNNCDLPVQRNMGTSLKAHTPPCNTPAERSTLLYKSNMQCDKTMSTYIAEMGSPSFDLGIDEEKIHDGSAILDDGLVLTEKNYKEFDVIIQEVLSSSGKKRQSNPLTPKSDFKTRTTGHHIRLLFS